MCWIYMGIDQIALDHPLCQTGKREKKCPKPSRQALGNVGKKMPQTIQHISKGTLGLVRF